MNKPTSRQMNIKRVEMLKFAHDNGFVINPSKGYEEYVGNVFEFGHCPCDSSRPNCPCDQAAEEVKEKGWCRCRLYYRDLPTFIGTLPLPKPEDIVGKDGVEEAMSDEMREFLTQFEEGG